MCTRCAFLAGATALVAAPAVALARTGDPQYLETAMPRMQRTSDTVWFGQLTANVWIFTTTKILDGDTGYYPANGAIVVQGSESLIIDAGWLPNQAAVVLDTWKSTGKPPITKALATHFHGDRTLGIPALKERGIPVFGNPLTIGLAQDNGLPSPRPLHDVEKHPVQMGSVEVFYPGAGHTIDNIVVSVPGDDLLFGGCLVKSVTSNGLGNVADSDIPAWPATMRTLLSKYGTPRYVIPGHGTIAGDPLAHTLELATAGKS